MDVELGVMFDLPPALASVAIAMQDVGLDVVEIFEGSLLITDTFHVGIRDLVDVEGSQLDLPAHDGQDAFDEPAFPKMTLDLGADRRRQATIGAHRRPVAPPHRAIAGLPAAPAASVDGALLHLARHVIAQRY